MITFDNFDVRRNDELADFITGQITERYDPRVFVDLHRKWPGGFILARDEGGALVGLAIATLLKPPRLRVLLLAVASHHRGTGLGQRLLARLERRGRTRGCREVTLEVRIGSPAIDFYRRQGYACIDRLPCYYQDGAEAVVMTRTLPDCD